MVTIPYFGGHWIQEGGEPNLTSGKKVVKKIITIQNVTDKIAEKIEDIVNKYPKNILLIIFNEHLYVQISVAKGREKFFGNNYFKNYFQNKTNLSTPFLDFF